MGCPLGPHHRYAYPSLRPHTPPGDPVASEDEVQRALGLRDAGQEIVVDVLRAGLPVQVKIGLAPRVP